MTLFCPKCGSLMKPKKVKGKKIMECSCGYRSKKVEKAELKETMDKKESVEVVEKEQEALPLVEKECPKCGHKKAYFWEVQTRASDEPATQFFKCEKCKHTWRHYD